MNFGFLGIQFGWALQMANMSAIYERLGAKPDELPGLWLAAPLTGLLVQPVVGYISDRIWTPLGRRRPFFLVGAILSCIGLVSMPYAQTVMQAALLLWMLDASINISMEPFRAFVSDLLPVEQRPVGYSVQSLLIGLGSIIAYALPFLLAKVALPATGSAQAANVTWAFFLGAAAFFSAVLWTVISTPEIPPTAAAEANPAQQGSLQVPPVLFRLAPIQFFTWMGLFTMWTYFSVTVSYDVFGATSEHDPLFRQGGDFAGLCFSFQSLVTFLFALALGPLSLRLGIGRTHALCLGCGAAGLALVPFTHQSEILFVSMAGVGIAWASILSLPYSMLSAELRPGNTGLWMGLFNACIVLPEILNALGFGWVMRNLLHNSRAQAIGFAAGSLALAAVLCLGLLGTYSKADETPA